MKNKKSLLTTLFSICMLCLFSFHVYAAAPFRGHVECKVWNSAGTMACFSISNDNYTEVAIYNKNGNFIESKIAKTTTYFENLKSNTLYYFTARSIDKDANIISNWSAKSAFCDFKPAIKVPDTYSKTVSFKCPKISGIESATLYLSTNSKSNFKKVKTIKPGKTYTTATFKGKDFSVNKKYYYKFKIITKSGSIIETPAKYFSVIYQ